MPAPRRRLAIIMAILTLEAAERKRDTEFWPYQSLRFLSQDVFLRPGLRLPSIFPSITSCRRRYFPLRIIWPKYSSLRLLISKSTSISLLIRFKTSTLLTRAVHGIRNMRRYIHISKAASLFHFL